MKFKHFESISCAYKGGLLIYKFPIEYDSEEFMQRLCRFIINDLSNNPYHNLNQRASQAQSLAKTAEGQVSAPLTAPGIRS